MCIRDRISITKPELSGLLASKTCMRACSLPQLSIATAATQQNCYCKVSPRHGLSVAMADTSGSTGSCLCWKRYSADRLPKVSRQSKRSVATLFTLQTHCLVSERHHGLWSMAVVADHLHGIGHMHPDSLFFLATWCEESDHDFHQARATYESAQR